MIRTTTPFKANWVHLAQRHLGVVAFLLSLKKIDLTNSEMLRESLLGALFHGYIEVARFLLTIDTVKTLDRHDIMRIFRWGACEGGFIESVEFMLSLDGGAWKITEQDVRPIMKSWEDIYDDVDEDYRHIYNHFNTVFV